MFAACFTALHHRRATKRRETMDNRMKKRADFFDMPAFSTQYHRCVQQTHIKYRILLPALARRNRFWLISLSLDRGCRIVAWLISISTRVQLFFFSLSLAFNFLFFFVLPFDRRPRLFQNQASY